MSIKKRRREKWSRPQITRAIHSALERKYWSKNWITFTEIQPGSAEATGGRRVDFVALKQSYKNPEIVGVEVKSGLDDFRVDEKWEEYCQYFTRFYIACPAETITIDMIPPGVGLLWWKFGDYVYTQQSAEIGGEIGVELLLALLFRNGPQKGLRGKL